MLVGLAGLTANGASTLHDLEPQVSNLATILGRIEPISRETALRRTVAQATFCLPQNVLGLLYYGLLALTGNVEAAGTMNEVTVIATRTPFGVSLGRFLFIDREHLTECAVRHEYGHTLQGYIHGPFYLPFEGLTSFAQACLSLLLPSYGVGYSQRWPEDEADRLGGVLRPRTP